MKRTSVICVFVILAAIFLYPQGQHKEPSSNDRYRLVSAEVMTEVDPAGNEMPMHTVFLVDVVQGRVWKYEPSHLIKAADGRQTATGEMFFPVGVLPNMTK